MKTEFKIFEGEWLYSLEDTIKEYQKQHNLEIKKVTIIKSNEVETIIGVGFERSSEYEELEEMKYRSAKWLYGEVGR